MLEAVTTDLVFTISLKRSTQILQLSTSCRPITPSVYPGPAPMASLQPGTASVKADVTTEEEIEIVRGAAQLAGDRDTQIIELLCQFNPELPLRPGEWHRAKICRGLFFVPNSKHSNKRANGPFRAIRIDTMPPPDRERLSELCRLLSDAVKEAGNWRRVNQRLGSRLARLCKDNNIRRLCLYAFRGTACARYKDAGFSPAEIAALMGQAVDTTSFYNYPQARQVRGKWRKKVTFRPDQHYVAESARNTAIHG